MLLCAPARLRHAQPSLWTPQDAEQVEDTPESTLAKELTTTQCQRFSDYLMKTLSGKLFEAKVRVGEGYG